jgi:hypothetical protein
MRVICHWADRREKYISSDSGNGKAAPGQGSSAALPQLRDVHIQRLIAAAQLIADGGNVHLRINPTNPPTIVWYNAGRRSVQHVILNAFGPMEPWKQAIDLELAAMVKAASQRNVRTAMRAVAYASRPLRAPAQCAVPQGEGPTTERKT